MQFRYRNLWWDEGKPFISMKDVFPIKTYFPLKKYQNSRHLCRFDPLDTDNNYIDRIIQKKKC